MKWPAAGLLAAAAIAGCGSSSATHGSGTTARPPAPAPPPKRTTHLAIGSGRGGVKLARIGNFTEPVYVTQPRGERRDLYVVEQSGAIRVVSGGRLLPKPFLDIGNQISSGGEQGLLSMAFAPDYERSGRFYVDYTDTSGDTRVVEYRRSGSDPRRADPASARPVLKVDQPESNHNGGQLQFGPDGFLYISLGDGGSEQDPNRIGQNLATPLAKILRIDPRPGNAGAYGIPASNPFAKRSGVAPETWSYGLRNPWRFSFDRKTGALLIGDVGQDEFEEVDYSRTGRGANFGWSAFEGNHPYNRDQRAPGAVKPALVYSHDDGSCSVTGGYVVRDPALRSLYGRYLYGDFCRGQLRSFIPGPRARDDRALGPDVPSISSFGEDSAGHVYVASLEGPVFRIDPK